MNAHSLSHSDSHRTESLRHEALHLLKAFAADLVDIDDPNALLWAVAERTISQLGWVDCIIYLKDPHRDVLIQKAAFGPKSIDYQAIFQPIEIPMGRGVVGKVASTGKSLRISDTSKFQDYIPDDAVRLSEMAVPILWGSEVLGVIDSEHPLADFYQIEDQLILETIAGITATKIQNARSASANAELALFYQRNPNPVFQLSSSGNVTFINETALRCFPARESSLKGRIGLEEALDKARQHGIAHWNCEVHPHSATSRTLIEPEPLQFEFHVVHLAKGGFNLYGSDITHILNLQRAAQVAHDAKSRFLSVMSHEIRTPLNAILGLTELLQHEEVSRDEQLRHLDYIDFSGRHLLSLVNDVLDLEKLASGKAKSVKTSFSLGTLVQQIFDGFQNRAQQVGLGWNLHLADDLPGLVQSDVKWVTQILNNLLGNAIKYTEQGQVDLSVTCGPPVHGRATDRHFILEVKDTGRGIPDSDLQRIFQPFEQVQDTSNIEGTGLGLSIVHSLVEQLGGQLSIASECGVGSTFTVSIPMTLVGEDIGDPLRVQPPTPTAEAPSEGGGQVLLADDNELNRFVASKLLSRWGYDVVEAVDGLDAIEKWNELGPCIVLMDVQMPDMDGIEATEQIRLQERERGWKRSPIIALTADAEEETHRRVLRAGMDDRIVKPFDTAALQTLLRRTRVGARLSPGA